MQHLLYALKLKITAVTRNIEVMFDIFQWAYLNTQHRIMQSIIFKLLYVATDTMADGDMQELQ